ncbi:dystrotelin [Chionomys nivalis]|uniref:dystrotelin n=1 Tax=Chionomys nivalis TaxID=269649 RepID=UPI0025995470|nr:dystrotelin [Chionomys nivalis]
MDPRKQGALNRIENSVYRTAFKLRSMQTLCQLDLMDSSLIQQVLSCGQFGESMETSLSVQQLFGELRELFQITGVSKPAQVHPRAPELTLSLLMAMYDSTGSGSLRIQPVTAALVALSGDSPLTKYRAFFQLYAENNRRGGDSRARMTRRALRAFLTDLQQIPAVVGESCTLCPVERAVHSCFRGVLSSGIKEEKFLSWLQSEPLILLWLPTCYRLSASEMLTHPVRCSTCKTFPIIGLRYRCLKCLNFDICQLCFLSGLHNQPHQKSHTVIEECVQMSTKERTKLLLKSLRNNLPQRPDRTRALGRQWLLDQLSPRDNPHHQQGRLLRKQLNRYKLKLQGACTLQKEQNGRFETKIRELATNQDNLWTKLQQIRQDLQAMLRPLRPSSSSQNTVLEMDHSLPTDGLWRGEDYSHIESVTGCSLEQELLPNSAKADRNRKCQASSRRALPDTESPEIILQSTRTQGFPQRMLREVHNAPSDCQEGLQDNPQIPPSEVSSPALEPSEGKETDHTSERRNDQEEEELQTLLPRLLDAFDLDTPPGLHPALDMDLYGRAEQVCRAFSALVDQITLPSLE